MSAVYGVNATKVLAGGTANMLTRGALGGKVRVYQDTYEASALASGSTIALPAGVLNAGDRIVGGAIYFDALGGSTTLAVGDSNSSTRYLAATSSASAGTARFSAVDGIDYVIGTNDGDDTILVTTGGASITGTVKIVVEYIND